MVNCDVDPLDLALFAQVYHCGGLKKLRPGKGIVVTAKGLPHIQFYPLGRSVCWFQSIRSSRRIMKRRDGWMQGCIYVRACVPTCVHAYARTSVRIYSIHPCIYLICLCMHGWMDAWMHRCTDAWMHGCNLRYCNAIQCSVMWMLMMMLMFMLMLMLLSIWCECSVGYPWWSYPPTFVWCESHGVPPSFWREAAETYSPKCTWGQLRRA